MKKTFAIVFSLFVCLTHTIGLGYNGAYGQRQAIPTRDGPATWAIGWGVGTATINKQKVPVGVWLWE